MSRRRFGLLATILTIVLSALSVPGAAEPVRLEYVGGYHFDEIGIPSRHVMGAEFVMNRFVLANTWQKLCLIDPLSFEPGQPHVCLDSIPAIKAMTSTSRDDGYVYVNVHLKGMAILHIDGPAETMTLVGELSEPGIYFENMQVRGDRLYVAAHAQGLRIYDLTDPVSPELVGSLTEGLVDTFAVAVSGDTAYLADGAGGLKVVDISQETSPVIVGGESIYAAAGTAEDVAVIDGHVYVASAAAGVAWYDGGDPATRKLFDTPGSAKQLTRVGQHLAVADISGVQLFAIEPDGSLTPAAREFGKYRLLNDENSLRVWSGVAAWGDDRLLAASWDTLDAYDLVNPAEGEQPDVTASTQRIRFAPGGGATTVEITNDGSGDLLLSNIAADVPTLSVQPANGLLAPGESMELAISYTGGQPGTGSVRIDSDDPDETPLPILIYGETSMLDPGEPAVPFTLESWKMNPETRQLGYSMFELASHEGQVVYFHVFNSW